MKQLILNGTSFSESADHFINQYGRLRDLAISPQGKVYICTDNGNNADVIIEISKQ